MKAYRLLLLLAPLALLHQQSAGKKIKQSLKIEKTSKTSKKDPGYAANISQRLPADSVCTIVISAGDTVDFNPASIRLSGYDKPVNARKESFLITNESPLAITGASLKITYRDMKGRMLHSRTASLKCNVPPGETRKTEISSWDTQNSFYYYLSSEPRKIAAPYKVEIQPAAFFVSY